MTVAQATRAGSANHDAGSWSQSGDTITIRELFQIISLWQHGA
jgi:hypothetical protein